MNILDTTNQNDQVQIPSNVNPVEVLLGPGGKYDVAKYDGDREKAIEAMARGKYEGDLYIDHFKARQDELRQDYLKLREEYNAGPKLKETLDQYMQELKQSQGNQSTQQVQEDKSAVLDETKLNDIVKQHIQANKQLETEESNAKTVESKLQAAYGANYKQVVKQQIDSIGMNVEFFNDMARKYPDALIRTLGIDSQRQGDTFQAPPTSTQRGDPFAGPVKRTYSYYQKMRKSDPERYRDPKTQDQMFKDYAALGPEFEDGEWRKLGHR